ncbi:hypothetical protein ACFQL0_01350 [Haloplanus litoreus]|uniref:hypothetical protein n=1 Tax=Haloplanus litoreus TaxID=767515 RepID=UPI003621546A
MVRFEQSDHVGRRPRGREDGVVVDGDENLAVGQLVPQIPCSDDAKPLVDVVIPDGLVLREPAVLEQLGVESVLLQTTTISKLS